MKKKVWDYGKVCLITLILVVAFVVNVSAIEESPYGIYFGTMPVTEDNKDNILGETNDDEEPTAKYDPDTKTLTLNNCTFKVEEPTSDDLYAYGEESWEGIAALDARYFGNYEDKVLKIVIKGENYLEGPSMKNNFYYESNGPNPGNYPILYYSSGMCGHFSITGEGKLKSRGGDGFAKSYGFNGPSENSAGGGSIKVDGIGNKTILEFEAGKGMGEAIGMKLGAPDDNAKFIELRSANVTATGGELYEDDGGIEIKCYGNEFSGLTSIGIDSVQGRPWDRSNYISNSQVRAIGKRGTTSGGIRLSYEGLSLSNSQIEAIGDDAFCNSFGSIFMNAEQDDDAEFNVTGCKIKSKAGNILPMENPPEDLSQIIMGYDVGGQGKAPPRNVGMAIWAYKENKIANSEIEAIAGDTNKGIDLTGVRDLRDVKNLDDSIGLYLYSWAYEGDSSIEVSSSMLTGIGGKVREGAGSYGLAGMLTNGEYEGDKAKRISISNSGCEFQGETRAMGRIYGIDENSFGEDSFDEDNLGFYQILTIEDKNQLGILVNEKAEKGKTEWDKESNLSDNLVPENASKYKWIKILPSVRKILLNAGLDNFNSDEIRFLGWELSDGIEAEDANNPITTITLPFFVPEVMKIKPKWEYVKKAEVPSKAEAPNKAIFAVQPKEKDADYALAYIKGYPDKTIRPDGNITRAEAVAMIVRLEKLELKDEGARFKDIEGWYMEAINAAYDSQLLYEREGEDFRPDDDMTRAEFSYIISKLDKDNNGKSNFADIVGHKFEKEINKVYGNGRIQGYPDGTFKPDNPITRAEVAQIVNSIYNRKSSLEAINKVKNKNDMRSFSDLNSSHWAYKELLKATNTYTYYGDNEQVWQLVVNE